MKKPLIGLTYLLLGVGEVLAENSYHSKPLYEQIFDRADISKYMNFSMDFINLLDDRYESSGYYDPWSGGNMFIPAADRHFLVGLHYSF